MMKAYKPLNNRSAMGRILAIDYGTKRLGLAITDPDRTMVFPREVMKVNDDVVEELHKYCQANDVSEIVIGIPYNEDHSETRMTAVMLAFAKKLKKEMGLSIIQQDEKFTTAEAHGILEKMQMPAEEQRKHKDVLAAMIILREYLDSL